MLGIQFVTLTNAGTTPILINKVAVASAGGDASRGISLPGPRPPVARREQELPRFLTFIPARDQTTLQSAALVVADSAAGSPQSVLLTGTPINPQASLSPFALTFPPQKVGSTSPPMTLTLENTGTTPLAIKTVSIGGNFAIARGTTCANGGNSEPLGDVRHKCDVQSKIAGAGARIDYHQR